MKRTSLLVAALGLGLGARALAAAEVDFSKDIKPVLEQACVKCHGPEKQKGKLRIDTTEWLMKGAKGEAVIVPGKSAESEIYKRVILPKGHDDIMPPEGDPLTKAQTDALKAWIDAGAKWPDGISLGAGGAPAATVATNALTARRANLPPLPKLPETMKAGPNEAAAIATIAKSGVEVRQVAINSAWREANFRLQSTNITDATIAPLKDIPTLLELNLATTRVTDAGLAAIAGLPYLTRLNLALTSVGDAGLAQIKGLTNLVYLNLYGSAVTDAGLAHLGGMKHLRNVYVWQSKVTEAGASKLKTMLPGIEVSTGAELKVIAKVEEKPKKDEKPAPKKDDKPAAKKDEKPAAKKDDKPAAAAPKTDAPKADAAKKDEKKQ